jgi:HD-GYP domain-containing protein (c-di-GMP phosphodiesterase class II)
MLRHISVNLGNLLLSLSDAMDLASPDLTQHQQRTAFVVWELGRAGGIPTERLERDFMAALLHDIGAFSLEDKIALLKCEVENTEEHCIRGEVLFNSLPWLKDSSKIVRFHHRQWQDWGDSIETPLVFDSQLLFFSDYLERQIRRDHYILHQNEGIISNLRSLSGSLFHPEIVNLFCEVSDREEFWLDIVSPRLYSLLLHEGPFRRVEIGLADISQISELFRNIIDFRSRFTSTHSSGVAASAAMLTRLFGLTETETKLMEVAGNLHDLGKLAIPNSILEKPGKLTKKEMAIMKSHTYYTYSVVNTIGGLQQIAEWAAYHHEKLDGSGYPFHCTAAELNTGARILMVADIFTALAEDRPYREKMSEKEIVRILRQFSDRGLLDTGVVNLVLKNFEELLSHMSKKQTIAREFYERQFSSIE